MTRRLPLHLAACATLLTLAAALPAGAEVQDVTIEVDPAAPTWQEDVTVTVRGESNCAIGTAFGQVDFVLGTGDVLRVLLEEACIVDPPSFQPFEVSVTFEELQPAEYTIQVTQAPDEAPVLAEGEVTVHPVADLEIDLPAMPPTDAAPFVITVSGVTSGCTGPEPAEVEGNVITLFFSDECPILPPGTGVQSFEYEVGPLPAGDYEIRVFRLQPFGPPALAKATVHVFDAEGCLPENDVLCLNQDRFAVRVQWADFQGNEGVGQTIPLLDDTGLFWFFQPDNVELTIKVIDACEPFGQFWVFVASGSTVEYEIRVTDTGSDPEQTNIYRNQLGQIPSLIADTAAFPCP